MFHLISKSGRLRPLNENGVVYIEILQKPDGALNYKFTQYNCVSQSNKDIMMTAQLFSTSEERALDIEKTLKNAGLRTTRQRRVILELLLTCGSPLSHAEILSKIEEHLDRVTLYRTLETLRKAGIVHQVQGIDGVWRFCGRSSRSAVPNWKWRMRMNSLWRSAMRSVQ